MKTFKLLSFIFIAGGIISVFLIGVVLYAIYQFYVPLGEGEAKAIQVDKGLGVKEIGGMLLQQNLIRSQFWFKAYVWLSGKQNKLQAGQYSVSPKLNIAEIVETLAGGKIVENDVWVTIPEGFTDKQIKEKLIEAGINSASNLGSETIELFLTDYNFLAEAPKKASLQGFLFPDTYKFKKEVSEKEILKKMLDNFGKKLTEKMISDIASQKRTIFEIVTLASILEKEVKSSSDRKIASGIFWQRIKDKYPLQSDATLSYIFDDKKDRHSQEETKVDSPYNTYKYIGLPPGPINSPGLDAILAAIYPKDSDYYFFLTKPDTGEAVFAKTLAEHNENKVKYLR